MKRVFAALMVLTACRHGAGTPTVATMWRWEAPQPAYVGAPAVVGDDVVATYGHSVLVALRNGQLRWHAERVGLRDVAPVAIGSRVVAATDDGLIAFDRDSGRLLWERALGDRASTPIIVGGRLVVTTWDGRLLSVDGWSLELPGPSLGPPAAVDGIVVAAWDTGVVGVDAASGAVRWHREFDGAGTSAPAVVGPLAVVVGGDRRAHAFDVRSGREQWSFAMEGAGSPEAPPAAARGLIAVADRLGHLVVADAGSGQMRWSADGAGAVVRGGPVFVGEAVALAVDDGRLMIATKSHRVFRDAPGRVSGVAATRDGLVVATREATVNSLTGLLRRD